MELTLTQIAEREGWKDTANLRRAIASGHLKARKVGTRLYLVEEREYKRWAKKKLGMQAISKSDKETA